MIFLRFVAVSKFVLNVLLLGATIDFPQAFNQVRFASISRLHPTLAEPLQSISSPFVLDISSAIITRDEADKLLTRGNLSKLSRTTHGLAIGLWRSSHGYLVSNL